MGCASSAPQPKPSPQKAPAEPEKKKTAKEKPAEAHQGGKTETPVEKQESVVPAGEGAEVPKVVFKARIRDPSIPGDNPFTWKDVSTEDIFAGKRVVVFALPGAFTPTCSSTHLPGYLTKYDEIKACGVDEIYCLSVNDAFVMRQWGLKQGLEEEKEDASNPFNPGNFNKVKLIPDGASLFTRGMGMSCVWEVERGFGERSWRYSMVVADSKIEKIFVEGGGITQDSGPDPFEVSDADTMLSYLKQKQ